MPEYEDFLDHTGRTPREFGAVHIHVEPVVRGPSGDAVATVWLQSAFEPLIATDSLHIVAWLTDNRGELSLKRLPLPALAAGKVVRWSLPLSLPEGLSELQFRVESKLHPKATRVRPAWKLFDTLEIPKESDMRSPSMSVEFDIADSVKDSVLSGGLSFSFAVKTNAGSSLSQDVSLKRHAAREMPPGFVAAVVEGTHERLEAPHTEAVWEPGRPLPEPVLVPAPAVRREEEAPRAAAGKPRTCFACGFEGPLAEYERARSCPRCDSSWL